MCTADLLPPPNSEGQRALEKSMSVLNGMKRFLLCKRFSSAHLFATCLSTELLSGRLYMIYECLLLNGSLIVVRELDLVTQVQQHLAVSAAYSSTTSEFCC